ncbi:type II secretion system secretin GspD [Methylomonas rhizoryzae]|uniref:type II secretion system secretin GspD n=1 Tax=Methylomonas rhizoryzae TaxID=2608981 RepID=UPI0012321581|nr:type II secretion system secretin GspD [Methylomonas rhizoryzae]
MKRNTSRITPLLALALTMTGCEFLGPQLHQKMPLPVVTPLPDDPAPEQPKVEQKVTKVEVFPNEEASIGSGSSAFAPKLSGGKGEYSLNFDDADLGEVAKVILSDILGKNYTLSPQVTGKVTLQTTQMLSKQDLIPTLEMILSLNNAALVDQNGIYLIKPTNEAVFSSSFKTLGSSRLPSGYQTRVIPVRNVSANEIADILKPLLPEKSLVVADPNRNILVVSGSANELDRILDVVQTFDIDMLKGRSFALFTPAHVDATKIIEELDQIFGRQGIAAEGDKPAANNAGGNGFFRFFEIERLNAILAITHNPKYLRDIETWVYRLDRTNNDANNGVNVYRAQHVNAVDLANTLGNIFGTGGVRGSNSASIASGRRSTSASNRSGSSGFSSSGSGSSASSGSTIGSSGSGTGSSSARTTSGTDNRALADRNNERNNSGFGGSTIAGSNVNTLGGTGFNNLNPEMANVRIIPDETNNALIIVAGSQEYAKIEKVIKQLDVLPLQVLIDATIVEVTLNNDLQYGIEWFFSHQNGGINEVSGGSPGKDSGGISLSDIGTAAATSGFSYAFASNTGDIKAVLNAAASKNNVNVISSPSLMVLNNQEASIRVGDSVPIRSSVTSNTSSTTTTNGIVQTSSIQMIDTGVNLQVRPRVNAGGLVLMDVLQSVDQAVKTDTSESIDSPTIQKREIQTQVAVQSGETLVLGGLIKEDNTYNKSGVPLLHEIPLLGPLFGATTRNKDKKELVVMITPRVVNSRVDAQLITDEFRRKLSAIYDVPRESAQPVVQ